jgi:hypothetical protein
MVHNSHIYNFLHKHYHIITCHYSSIPFYTNYLYFHYTNTQFMVTQQKHSLLYKKSNLFNDHIYTAKCICITICNSIIAKHDDIFLFRSIVSVMYLHFITTLIAIFVIMVAVDLEEVRKWYSEELVQELIQLILKTIVFRNILKKIHSDERHI